MSQTFDELVAEIDGGTLNTELSREMREMIECLAAKAKMQGEVEGEIALKVKFVATGQGRVEISTKTTLKRPGIPDVTETRHIGRGGALLVTAPRLTFGGVTAGNDGPSREGA